MNDASAFFEKHKIDAAKMKQAMPETMAAFGGMFKSTMGNGALTEREKELIALGMGIVLRCLPCINLHVKKCLEAGATREQILEVSQVAIMMQGGPGYTYVPVVIDALEACGA